MSSASVADSFIQPTMAEKNTRYRIGYALAPKKVQTFIKPSLLNLAKERGIDLFPIQLTEPLIDQAPFDCIIHKLPDPEWTNQLKILLSHYPIVVVIDNPEAIELVNSRVTMLEAVSHLKPPPGLSVEVPLQVFVESPESLLAASEGINLPVIAKPLIADGSSGSHQMYLVVDDKGLGELKLDPPFVLQEFVNHGGVIFKVYVAGRHIQCVKRRSLPYISPEKLGTSEKLIPFSQISDAAAIDYPIDDESSYAAELPPLEFVNVVANQLRQGLKLNLFNFDMIRDSRAGGRYLIIDINYFPGYAKMPSYETILTDFFLYVVKKLPTDC
ncbi:hypothetical protein CASFOL_003486 [Castilleja foliolosa]|uniref:Inositol-tetrakisphosphate 1-kinase n=1 Tax=Castilleja foliolosa TaxID=1961234 RepID=A0ABD3EHB0_9LAMI